MASLTSLLADLCAAFAALASAWVFIIVIIIIWPIERLAHRLLGFRGLLGGFQWCLGCGVLWLLLLFAGVSAARYAVSNMHLGGGLLCLRLPWFACCLRLQYARCGLLVGVSEKASVSGFHPPSSPPSSDSASLHPRLHHNVRRWKSEIRATESASACISLPKQKASQGAGACRLRRWWCRRTGPRPHCERIHVRIGMKTAGARQREVDYHRCRNRSRGERSRVKVISCEKEMPCRSGSCLRAAKSAIADRV
jgi:hypothetical protein